MRALSSLFRFIAWNLMSIVVVLLPLALFGRAVGQLLFTEEGLARALSQRLLDEEVFATVVEELVHDSISSSTGDSPEDEYFSRVLSSLDHDQWVQVTSLVAPEELMRSTASEFFSGFYSWLEGESAVPDFTVDMQPWKLNIESSKIEVVEIFLDTIPNCSPAQVNEFTSAPDLPFCKPPEPHYSNLLAEITAEISTMMADFPEEFSMFGNEMNYTQESLQEIARLKQILLLIRSILRYGWMIALVLFLVAIPMGARSLPGFFKWAGMPLLLAGLGALMTSILVSVFGGSLLTGFSSPVFSDTPSTLATPINAIMTGVVTSLVRPMVWQSVILIVLGAVSVALGTVINRMNSQYEADFRPAPSRENTDMDEDSPSPSGMFG